MRVSAKVGFDACTWRRFTTRSGSRVRSAAARRSRCPKLAFVLAVFERVCVRQQPDVGLLRLFQGVELVSVRTMRSPVEGSVAGGHTHWKPLRWGRMLPRWRRAAVAAAVVTTVTGPPFADRLVDQDPLRAVYRADRSRTVWWTKIR
jgi:hypothetical protein